MPSIISLILYHHLKQLYINFKKSPPLTLGWLRLRTGINKKNLKKRYMRINLYMKSKMKNAMKILSYSPTTMNLSQLSLPPDYRFDDLLNHSPTFIDDDTLIGHFTRDVLYQPKTPVIQSSSFNSENNDISSEVVFNNL